MRQVAQLLNEMLEAGVTGSHALFGPSEKKSTTAVGSVHSLRVDAGIGWPIRGWR
jgi:hypothetical protein